MLGVNWDITRQKESEQELKISNDRNSIFVQQSPNAIAMFNKEMRYIAASRKWHEDYNLIGKELIGKTHYEIFPEISEDWKKIHSECLLGAINKIDEAPFLRADGTVQWITWDVRPWYISAGKIGGLLMYTADITALKDKDKESKNIKAILDKTNDIARIGTWEVITAKNEIVWSKVINEIHEVPPDYKPDFITAVNFFKRSKQK